MALVTVYDPFGEMKRMQNEMDSVFAGFFESQRCGRDLMQWGTRAPLADIEDSGDSLVVAAELPGMGREDIKIAVDKDTITISAERKGALEDKKKSYYYLERTYSGYNRSFALPQEIDPDSVDAQYKDGILRIALKKAIRGAQKREVKIR